MVLIFITNDNSNDVNDNNDINNNNNDNNPVCNDNVYEYVSLIELTEE